MNKLKWRLSKLPTPDEVVKLLTEKLITKDEAREILFSLETEEEKSVKGLSEDLKSEIKFLRELVQRLSNNSNVTIVEKIREVAPFYKPYRWNEPYIMWCSSQSGDGSSGTVNAMYIAGGGGNGSIHTIASQSFQEINTF